MGENPCDLYGHVFVQISAGTSKDGRWVGVGFKCKNCGKVEATVERTHDRNGDNPTLS